MSEDNIQIEVDGKPLTAKKGQMLIEVTDANDIPRYSATASINSVVK